MAGAVLFDVDGTLVDSETAHALALVDVVEGLGLTVPPSLATVTGQPMHVIYDLIVAELGDFMTFREFLETNHAAYLARSRDLALRPGAEAALAAVRSAGVPMAFVSNAERIVLEGNLNAVGLNRIDLISVSRNDVRRPKPDPEPYLRAAWLLEVDPADCLVVEDSFPGAAAGLAAGMRVIAWPEPHRADATFPDGVIAGDPRGIADLLTCMLSGG